MIIYTCRCISMCVHCMHIYVCVLYAYLCVHACMMVAPRLAFAVDFFLRRFCMREASSDLKLRFKIKRVDSAMQLCVASTHVHTHAGASLHTNSYTHSPMHPHAPGAVAPTRSLRRFRVCHPHPARGRHIERH